ncbi:MAG TPA: protoheme IX farnesyltransferase [Porticoccaceae bacterium]|nr:protoheme IX farnesyltransferase [Porticoccaceae bacterium]
MSSANSFSNTFKSFFELMKPRVMSLVIFTALVGIVIAPTKASFFNSAMSLLFVALGAGAAGALNMWYDAEIDGIMSRTCLRPIPLGKVKNNHALIFGTVLSFASVIGLYFFSNLLSACILAVTILFYIFIYTIWLKRSTPQNIVIGGLAGAAPPLLGWTAVTGEIHYNALLLVLIIYAWTPPHFWALAIHRKEEYATAKIPMLPVTHGERYTKINIVLYTLLLIVITILPFLTGMFGWLYLTGALTLGLGFLYWSFVMLWGSDKDSGMKTFKYSITYLMVLFCVMLLDHYLIEPTRFIPLA